MYGDYSRDGTLNIKVTNLCEFKSLINKAKKQADELQETIDQLEFFDLKVKFSMEDEN